MSAALVALFSRGHCLVVGLHGLPPAGLVAFDAGPHAGFAAPRPPKVAGLAKPNARVLLRACLKRKWNEIEGLMAR